MQQQNSWRLLKAHYRDQPQYLVQPHIDSYNDFLKTGLPDIIQKHNPLLLSARLDPSGNPMSQCHIFLGGKDGQQIHLETVRVANSKGDASHVVLPNEARLRDMTYAVALYVDVEVELTEWLRPDEPEPEYARLLVAAVGEKRVDDEDAGIVVRRHASALEDDDLLEDVFRKRVHEELARHATEKRKALETALASVGDALPTVSESLVAVAKTYRASWKHVFVGHIPLVVQSQHCVLSQLTSEMRFGLGECRQDVGGYLIVDGQEKFAPLVWSTDDVGDEFTLHVNDDDRVITVLCSSSVVPLFAMFRALGIESDKEIIEYIVHDLDTRETLVDEALAPCVYHASHINTRSEALAAFPALRSPPSSLTPYALGQRVRDIVDPTRMRRRPRRVEAMGAQLQRAFQQEWAVHISDTKKALEQHLYNNHDYQSNLYALIFDHSHEVFRNDKLLLDFSKQLPTLNRTSFLNTIHDLRSFLPTTDHDHDHDHGREYGFVDPWDQSLAMSAIVSRASPVTDLLTWIKKYWSMSSLDDFRPRFLADMTNVHVNGSWVGVVDDPQSCRARFLMWRYNGLVPVSISCTFFPERNCLELWCDAGRLLRPLVKSGVKLKPEEKTWTHFLTGSSSEDDPTSTSTTTNLDIIGDKKRVAAVEMMDEYESSMALIRDVGGTHSELHGALSLGWASQHLVFVEHQSPLENARHRATMKRVVSTFSTNASMRAEKETSLLVSGQIPLVQSQLLDQMPIAATTLGHNVVIGVWSGGCWLNQGAVQRGLLAHVAVRNADDTTDPSSILLCTTTEDGAPLMWSQHTEWVPADAHGSVVSTRGSPPVSAQIVAETDMPFFKDGTRPDLMVSEHNVALIYELLVGKFATVLGGQGRATPFDNDVHASLGGMGRLLTAMGYHSSGNTILYDGHSGKQLETEIYVGLSLAMKQEPKPVQMRRRGLRHVLTRQATDDGALLEDVDVVTMLGHGLSATAQDAMMDRGDKYTMAVCNVTGTPAIYHPSRNVFFSPSVDGPVQFIDNNRVDLVTSDAGRRPLSVVCVPYAFKLFMQELRSIGIQVRLVTDDQVDQHGWNVARDEKRPLSTTTPGAATSAVQKKKSLHTSSSSATLDYHSVMHLLESKERDGGGKKKVDTADMFENVTQIEDDTAAEEEAAAAAAVRDDGPSVGQRVCLQGVTDGYVDRPWEIVRIGDAFCTLRALDATNLTVKDQIRVVPKTDMIPEMQMLQQPQQQPFYPQQMQQQPFYPQPFQQQPQGLVLNIAPKFVNGPDHSQEVVSTPQPQMMQQDSFYTTPMPAGPMPAPAPAAATAPAAQETKDIDFTKLVIVKKM